MYVCAYVRARVCDFYSNCKCAVPVREKSRDIMVLDYNSMTPWRFGVTNKNETFIMHEFQNTNDSE